MAKKTGAKGILLEETLRAYFIRAGLFAMRGIPLTVNGEELSDIDIWLYEIPTGSSRRRLILDAKAKTRPKAVERLFWTKGVFQLLRVDGAYIATTDTRPLLKRISRDLGIYILDGTDLKRMRESGKILFPDRLHEEDMVNLIQAIDQSRRSKELYKVYRDLKASLVDEFGPGTANRALDSFGFFANVFTESHPMGDAAAVGLRLAYLSASLVAIALDFVLTSVSFKSNEERRNTMVNVIRYGFEDEDSGLENVRIATALVEKYAANGRTLAQNIEQAIRRDMEKIPAEEVADYIVNNLKSRRGFELARNLEQRAFSRHLVGYDALSPEEKAFIGLLLDFSGIGREYFASGWTSGGDVLESDRQDGGSQGEMELEIDASASEGQSV